MKKDSHTTFLKCYKGRQIAYLRGLSPFSLLLTVENGIIAFSEKKVQQEETTAVKEDKAEIPELLRDAALLFLTVTKNDGKRFQSLTKPQLCPC